MNRFTLIISLIFMLGLSSIGQANPGGVGDGDFDMQCGGACHGDSSQNQTSPAQLDLSIDAESYVGLPISISGTISGIQFSSSEKIGLFLLTDTTGHSDLPEDAGWDIISDINGGANNYVEIATSSLTEQYSVSWTLKPNSIKTTEFYLSIHHGGEEIPFFGISSGLSIDTQPIPDNLPRLAEDFSPPISRELGVISDISIKTLDVEQLQIEWRLVDGEAAIINATSMGDDLWAFQLPAALQPSIIEWRAILKGEGPNQETPWFRIAAQEPILSINQNQIYLQSMAFCLLFAGLVLTLHAHFIANGSNYRNSTYEFDEATLEAQHSPSIQAGELPEGWTMEQWEWYGAEYLEAKQ